MVVTEKIKKNTDDASWTADILLVFFPQKDHQKQQLTSNHILTRTQSTISICALLIFLTFLLFAFSTTFEPENRNNFTSANRNRNSPAPALQRLGTLYTRGTIAMDNLILCHVTETVTTQQLKLFLRVFHRSGLHSSSDLLFLFDSITTPESFDNVIREENDVFLKIVGRYRSGLEFRASFDPTRFLTRPGEKVVERGEPIWGWKIKRKNYSSETESTRASYGSVVGFGVGEVDPENSLSGFFLGRVPMSLRRWACYPMILGRVRRSFKHVVLVDVAKILLLGDPLGRVKNTSPDSVFLSSTPRLATEHGFKRSELNTRLETIDPGVIMGGVRGIRRLSAAMLAAIVRATMNIPKHDRRKNISVTEWGVLSRLATNEFTLKSVRVSITGVSSVSESWIGNETILWVEQHSDYFKDIESVIMKHICSFAIDSAVYRDC